MTAMLGLHYSIMHLLLMKHLKTQYILTGTSNLNSRHMVPPVNVFDIACEREARMYTYFCQISVPAILY